ncbi:MAG TPA: arginine--tRNA ligase [Salinivirga sp.]|uniref:arginine--tRNA ligase n=1 Tax=Salinivirga sp. TaxID=1970192 RepID=UPI002B472C48|nr:arginine--tRNA ligase [Salinivirga sp.]HKK58150.1 arginine--tRNA ligase [Salinivirga sp.]
MNIEQYLNQEIHKALERIFEQEIDPKQVQIQRTKADFEGDFTLVVFPLLRLAKTKPEDAAKRIGDFLVEKSVVFDRFNVVKGFLNLTLSHGFWLNALQDIVQQPDFGFAEKGSGKKIMIEYSSPNTNKPLHLGHIRNNLLGYAVARILEACGNEVVKVNLVNDRGIHICKSMLAWQRWGEGKTPSDLGVKGDKLVGDFYVRFDQEYKKQIEALKQEGKTEDEAKDQAPLILEAREMLRKWEDRDSEVMKLWEQMNSWVYEGFDETYNRLGIEFDKVYYESDTYKKGKELVLNHLEKGLLKKKEDGSVWADLTEDKLDEKILLRSDGTSVYMTQDLGTAVQRFADYDIDQHVYVVGNEQDYHFKVLSLILKKMGYEWATQLFHLSYGMVELPSGKMKSREGTVVDADDLIDTMISTAAKASADSGKLEGMSQSDIAYVHNIVALGALKYFILKVDPKKNMLFNPEESIDFNGNTGPFIQYTHARIRSLMRKADVENQLPQFPLSIDLQPKEQELIQQFGHFPNVVAEAGKSMNPGFVANYLFDLVKTFNQFYHDHSVLNETDEDVRNLRLSLSWQTGQIIKNGMWLLGIDVPERM